MTEPPFRHARPGRNIRLFVLSALFIVSMDAPIFADTTAVQINGRLGEKPGFRISATAGIEFHVATNGNDSATGGADAPFRTLERARDEIRRLKAAGGAWAGATVLVHGGTYYLDRTFALGPQDSGASAAPVIYQAYQNEKPELVGGHPIANFRPYRGNILKADTAAQGITNYFRQLIFDGRRQWLARYPNFDASDPVGGGWAYVDGKPIEMYEDIRGEAKNMLQYKEKDSGPWLQPGEGEIFVFPRFNWWNNIIRIRNVDRARRQITLSENASYSIRPGDRYYVQNLLAELDAPGEWYLERTNQTLYFWPPSPISEARVCAPTLRTIVEFGPGTANVTFRGFTIEGCEGTAVSLESATNCLIAANTIHDVGDYDGNGVSIEDGRHNGVEGNDIYDIGSRGIFLSGGDFQTLRAGENYAENNQIYRTGVYYKQGAGITLEGVGNRASHNLIYDEPRYGIEFSGNNHVIEFNHIHHVCLETSDTGAIESWNVSWTRRGTEIRYNYIHDVIGYGQENGHWVSPNFAWGIYLDDGTSGTHVFGNIVVRSPRGGLHIHGGRDNVIENNIFADGVSQEITYTGYTPKGVVPDILKNSAPFLTNTTYLKDYPALSNFDLKTAWQLAGTVFQRNIIYYHQTNAALSEISNLQFDKTVSDSNLFYHFNQPVFSRGRIPAAMREIAKKLDQHSLMVDPLFVAADKDDYRLRTDSPAWKFGFQPVPVEKIGLFADSLRASWPVVEDLHLESLPVK